MASAQINAAAPETHNVWMRQPGKQGDLKHEVAWEALEHYRRASERSSKLLSIDMPPKFPAR